MDEPPNIYGRIWRAILFHPAVLAPGLGGAALAFAGLFLRFGSRAAMFGAVLMWLAATIAAIRWMWKGEEIFERARDEADRGGTRSLGRRLDRLDARLRGAKAERGRELLRALRPLHEGFLENLDWTERIDDATADELRAKVDRLHEGCVAGLERVAELAERAERMRAAGAADAIDAARERVLAEVALSVDHMRKLVAEVQKIALDRTLREGEGLADIRRDLEATLDVARRVEERMSGLDGELDRASGLERER